MRCSKAQKLISLRMDDRLSARSAEKLELHVARCSSCRAAAENLHRAWLVLGAAGRPGPAPDDWSAIQAGIDARRRRWLPPWVDLASTRAAAACALAVMALLGGAGGLILGRRLHQARPVSLESAMIAETLGELPWNSPVSGVDQLLDERDEEGRP